MDLSCFSDTEKIAAFDALAVALTNCWHTGRWSWWCRNPAGGRAWHENREEAVKDLVAWAVKTAKRDSYHNRQLPTN